MSQPHPLYSSLATMLEAGIALQSSLELLSRTVPGRGWRKTCHHLHQSLVQGATLAEAMAEHPTRFEPHEVALVQVGERAGNLDEVLVSLNEEYELSRDLWSDFRRGLIYPLLLLNAAILLPPLKVLVLGSARQYWDTVRPGLLALWGVLILLALLKARGRQLPLVQSVCDRMVFFIPWLRSAVRHLSWARIFSIMRVSLAAGLRFDQGLQLAAASCPNGLIRRRLLATARGIDDGLELGQACDQYAGLSSGILALIKTGETSGTLEAIFTRLSRMEYATGERALRDANRVLCWAVYLGTAAYIAYVIIRSYGEIFASNSALFQ